MVSGDAVFCSICSNGIRKWNGRCGETGKIVTNGGTETADDDTGKDIDNTDKQVADLAVSSGVAVTIDEWVLIDQKNIMITVTEYVTDSIWGDGIKLLLENNSDKDVTTGCNGNLCCNPVMFYILWW